MPSPALEPWSTLSQRLEALLRPETFPVAVTWLKEGSEIPSRARRPSRDLGIRMAPCQGAAMARRYGWRLALGREDQGCAIAAHTYGWEEADPEGALAFLTRMNYARDEAAARSILEHFRRLGASSDLVVLYAPLGKVAWDPDVVLIYANPAQMMRLIHGATYTEGRPLEGSFSGRAASCTEGIVAAHLDQAPKVVVPGNGDRVWAGCQDHEMVMAIPANALAGVVEGLEKTHARGVRYPIPTYLRYTPEVAFSTPLSEIFRQGAKGREEGR